MSRTAVRGLLRARLSRAGRFALSTRSSEFCRGRVLGLSIRAIGIRTRRARATPAIVTADQVRAGHRPVVRSVLRCSRCQHVSKFGNCLQPVKAGISPKFELVRHPSGGEDCALFAMRGEWPEVQQ